MTHFKKLFALAVFALAFAAVGPRPAFAGSKYYVALTTVPVNGSTTEFAANYPNISGNLYVRKIVVANSTATVAQTVSLYDTCTSTSTGALKLQFYTGAASQVTAAVQEFNWLPQSFRLSSPCFKKSGTTSTVDFSIFYE